MIPIPAAVAPVPYVPQLINLGVVYKSRAVLEAVEHALRSEGKL